MNAAVKTISVAAGVAAGAVLGTTTGLFLVVEYYKRESAEYIKQEVVKSKKQEIDTGLRG